MNFNIERLSQKGKTMKTDLLRKNTGFTCFGLMRKTSGTRMCVTFFIIFAAFLQVSVALPDVSLPSIFGSNMVLQRDMKVPVWGTAGPGEKVTVSIDGKSVRTTAGKDGRWMVKLDKMEAGGPFELVVRGGNTVKLTGILVGDVWVCSGQSNMQWAMSQVKNNEQEIASADYPDIRLFSVSRVSKTTPQYDFPGTKPEWVTCNPETVKSFSAVAYFFGKNIHKEIGVPIGLIHSSWGGSFAEAWTRLETLKSVAELRPLVENLDTMAADYPGIKAEYDRKNAELQKAAAEGKQVTLLYPPPRGPETRDWPAGLYNAMIAPMVPYAIRGVIWYQGESNSICAWQYRTLFPTMISDWRDAWKQGDFPFLFVQLANWETETVTVTGGWGSWPELREAQVMTLSLPNTAMAVTIDIGDPGNIHPNNKAEVGRRLALGALHVAYDRSLEYSGPMYASMKVEGGAVRLKFTHTADGLKTPVNEALAGFEIAGSDKVFHSADARIEGNEVVVSSDRARNPVAVRYGWDDNPRCNLYNSAGLPASPFRTDSWPGITDGRLKP
ncbi:sialate O-acetylesterase [bacterium]|nr:sialate O-acetylesterase [bacterium]